MSLLGPPPPWATFVPIIYIFRTVRRWCFRPVAGMNDENIMELAIRAAAVLGWIIQVCDDAREERRVFTTERKPDALCVVVGISVKRGCSASVWLNASDFQRLYVDGDRDEQHDDDMI